MAWTVDGNSYVHRKKITIQGDNVDAALTSYPLVVVITDDAEIGADTNADEYGNRFDQTSTTATASTTSSTSST